MVDLREMERKQRCWTLISWALMVAAPFVLLSVVSLLVGKNAFATFPEWSDEMDYWRSLFDWIHVGVPKGYSGVGEYPPILGTLSVHGVTPLMLYGGLASLLGLNFHSIVLYNALWVSVGALTFCIAVKPKAWQALVLAGLLLVYTPIVLYCITSMTEMVGYALLLFYLAWLFRYAKTGGKAAMALCWATVLFMCVYRITFFVLFLPPVWLLGGRRFGKKTVGFGLLALALSALAYVGTALVTAPFPGGFLYNWLRTKDFGMFLQMFFSHAKANLYDYFLAVTDSPMENGFRWLYMGVMGLCLLGSFLRLHRQGGRFSLRLGVGWVHLACFLMLFLPFAAVVMIYETNDWADYRTLAPFLWGVAAALALRGRRGVPGVVLAGSVVMVVLLSTLPNQQAYSGGYRFQQQPFSPAVQEACQTITYDPEAQNPWTNTIRADICTHQTISQVPPGMGFLYGWFTTENTGQSRWILTDHLKIVVQGYEAPYVGEGCKVYRLIESYEE